MGAGVGFKSGDEGVRHFFYLWWCIWVVFVQGVAVWQIIDGEGMRICVCVCEGIGSGFKALLRYALLAGCAIGREGRIEEAEVESCLAAGWGNFRELMIQSIGTPLLFYKW